MPELGLGMALDFARSHCAVLLLLKIIKPVNQVISRLSKYPRGVRNILFRGNQKKLNAIKSILCKYSYFLLIA